MSEILEFDKRARVRGQASVWLTRLQEGLTASQQRELVDWLADDGAHQATLLELATIWDELEVLTELAPLFEGVNFPLAKHSIKRKTVAFKLSWRPLALAASLLVVVTMGRYFLIDVPVSSDSVLASLKSDTSATDDVPFEAEMLAKKPGVRLFRTEIGQQLELNLDDGSVATLNTDTQIAVSFSKQQRIIHLLHGEAHFKVFNDAARPLKVLVSGKSVQAVGTAFSVRKKNGTEIEVAVDHGLVTVYQLSSNSQKKSSPALKASLDAGDVLIIADEEPSLIEYDLEQMEDRLAWREGMIVINDETLDYVITEFGRYSEQKVLLADRKMGEIRVAGYFRLGDVDALLVALEKNFKIRSEYYQQNKTFVLSQIPQPTL